MPKQKPSPSKRFSRTYWLRLSLFAVVIIIIAALFTLTSLIQRQIEAYVIPHRNRDIGTPLEITDTYDDVILTTSDDVTISGWYIPGRKPQAIVLVHGLNVNRRVMLPEASVLAQAGFPLLLIDLRGHGLSGAAYNSYGYHEAFDIQAGVDYLLTKPEIEKVGVLGISLGGSAVVRAAAIDPRIEAVVVESSFSSLPAAVDDAFDDISFFPKWPFAPLLVDLAERRVGVNISQVDSARDLAAMAPRPVMIIHGNSDGMFPLHHAETMYQAAQEPKSLWVIDNMTHANPVIDRKAEFADRVVSFFEMAFE